MFNLSMPYDNDHPLFRLEVRRIRWGKSPRQLRRYSYSVFGIIGLIILVVLVGQFSSSLPGYNYAYWILMNFSKIFIPLIFVSILVDIILDMACFTFTQNSVDTSKRKMWSELMWLASSGIRGVISAKYALAQVRAWRVMIVIVGVRIVTVIVVLGFFLTDWLIYPDNYMDVGGYVILAVPVLVVFFGTYLLEPLWRMRAMTALGLWISSREHNAILAGLIRFGVIIAVWISQIVIMGILALITLPFVHPRYINNVFIVETLTGLGMLPKLVMVALIIYYYYYFLGQMSLNHAQHNTFHE